jgi:protein-disulfide isomerase
MCLAVAAACRVTIVSTLLFVSSACSGHPAAAPGSAGTTERGGTLAEVNGASISAGDVDASIAPALSKLQDEIYSSRLASLNSLIDARLIAEEAKKRGLSPDAFVAAELAGKVAPVTDADIAAFYEQNKARLDGDPAKWHDQIRSYLQEKRETAARAALMKRLRESGDVKVFLTPPEPYRAKLDLAGAQVRGQRSAPVTLVEFSDFHCPFCRQVQPILLQILQKYGTRVRLVYKDMPIDGLHPQARSVAEAARCAADQGRFWEFHDKVYANPPDGSAVRLQDYASQVGLDGQRFENCRSSRKYERDVQRDVQEGADLGITGTPAFFIDGRVLSGAQPLETFTRIIDEELSTGSTATR